MAKVDIVIPAYNAARYLPMALESVVAQTFKDWQIVLVDDGSTDNTAEVVAPFLEQLGDKLRYFKQKNAGMSAARNVAIRRSSSEFVALLDADDVWLPDRIAHSLKSFEGRTDVGLSYGFISRIGPDGLVIDTFADRQRNGEGWIARSIYTRQVYLPCVTVTVRRQCLDEVGVFDESFRATEDRDLWLRIAQRYQVALVPHVIALYRTSPDSMTTDPELMLRSQHQFIEKNYGSIGCGWLSRRQALSGIYKERATALATRRRIWAAFASSLRALLYYPLDGGAVRTAGSLLLKTLKVRA